MPYTTKSFPGSINGQYLSRVMFSTFFRSWSSRESELSEIHLTSIYGCLGGGCEFTALSLTPAPFASHEAIDLVDSMHWRSERLTASKVLAPLRGAGFVAGLARGLRPSAIF